MKADYKNWVPKGMIYGLGAATIGLTGATVAARRNLQGRMVGIDRWGAEYASCSQKLCKQNASAEDTANVSFQKGENSRIDWFIEKLYTPKGFFTPPYETAHSLRDKLSEMYAEVTLNTVEAMACFSCKKGE